MNQQQRDAAAQQWLSRAQKIAADVLAQNETAWQTLTQKLLQHETVDGQGVKECFEQQKSGRT